MLDFRSKSWPEIILHEVTFHDFFGLFLLNFGQASPAQNWIRVWLWGIPEIANAASRLDVFKTFTDEDFFCHFVKSNSNLDNAWIVSLSSFGSTFNLEETLVNCFGFSS